MPCITLLMLLLMLIGAPAWAAATQTTAAVATPAQPASPLTTNTAPAAGGDFSFDLDRGSGAAKPTLDFNLMDDGSKFAQQERLRQQTRIARLVKIRRTMLQLHQAVGFSMLAVLSATVVIGQLDYLDKYVSGAPYTYRYDQAHLGLGIASFSLFGATGLLALLAPNPYPKAVRFDTALVHKISMILATAGMVTQVVLGPFIVAHDGLPDQGRLAAAHLGVGYATWAFTAAGVLAYTF